MRKIMEGKCILNHDTSMKLHKLEQIARELHQVIFRNLGYTKCHSRLHRIPRPLDHDYVWSSVLFRPVLRVNCVSRPSYANSKARYGIKSRRLIRVYSLWHYKKHTQTHKKWIKYIERAKRGKDR